MALRGKIAENRLIELYLYLKSKHVCDVHFANDKGGKQVNWRKLKSHGGPCLAHFDRSRSANQTGID